MSYVAGAIAGLILGGVAGQLKNLFIWQRYLKKSASDEKEQGQIGGLYARAMISYFVNILTLAAAFFLRNIVPFNWVAFLIGTAAALSGMNKILTLKQKKAGKEVGGL